MARAAAGDDQLKLGVVSDIHCQHQALAKALDAMGPVDRLVCAGDVIDQTRFCARTVGLLRERGIDTITGNHEIAYFSQPGSFDEARLAEGHGALARWLQSRPAILHLHFGEASVRIVHATSWNQSFDYVPPSHRDFRRFAECGADIVVYGHTHQPVVRHIGSSLVVNPGSVGEGRPDPRGFIRSCAVIDCQAKTARIVDLD